MDLGSDIMDIKGWTDRLSSDELKMGPVMLEKDRWSLSLIPRSSNLNAYGYGEWETNNTTQR